MRSLCSSRFSFFLGENITGPTLKIHMENLNQMSIFCSNKLECRRVQMLRYFGEIFDKALCLADVKTACDNCTCKVWSIQVPYV